MKAAFLALMMLVGCAESEPASVESAVTESSPNEPTFSPGFDSSGPPQCPYVGGCDRDVHPSSGHVSVDGKDCVVDGTTATLHMDPSAFEQNLTWELDVDAGSCGELHLEGTHFEKYPITGTASVGESDGDAAIQLGPMNHVPKKIIGTAKVDGKSVDFRFYFGDES